MRASHLLISGWVSWVVFALGCSPSEELFRDASADAASPDAASPDAEATDALPPKDGGIEDGGIEETPDAGETDAAPLDGGSVSSTVSALCGWAAVSGDGVATTTGGGDLAPVVVTTAAELESLAADPEPRVIHVQGMIDLPRLVVSSDKTIVGLGPSSGLNGGIRVRGQGLEEERVSNVILSNLRINAAASLTEGETNSDGIQIYFAHHVWLDHLEVFDAPDGNTDITHASDYVTVSWTKFHYTANAPQSDHRFSNLLGHSDGNADEDQDRLRVTFHHDWWAEGVVERMPRVRFGFVHLLNNYYSSSGNNYCVGAGLESRIIVESNAFAGVSDPNILYDDEPTAGLLAIGNSYQNTTGDQNGTYGLAVPALPPDYVACPVDAAGDVPALVAAGAGPR